MLEYFSTQIEGNGITGSILNQTRKLNLRSFVNKLKLFIDLARLDRFTGIWLVFVPAYSGMILASMGIPSLGGTSYLFFGAVLVRSLACIINDLTDSNLDKLVERTKSRPLASGKISKSEAMSFAGILIIGCIALLMVSPPIVIKLSFFGALLIIAYPWMKRITYWPQAFLGMAMSYSSLLGYAYVTKTVAFPAWVIFITLFFWTLFYDTLYAFQDIKDDLKAGIKSSALALSRFKVSNSVSKFSILCVTCMLCGFIFLAIYHAPLRLELSMGVLTIMASFFLIQVWRFDPDNKELCGLLFRQQKYAGALMLLYLLSLHY